MAIKRGPLWSTQHQELARMICLVYPVLMVHVGIESLLPDLGEADVSAKLPEQSEFLPDDGLQDMIVGGTSPVIPRSGAG
jgi:hypothetical protein